LMRKGGSLGLQRLNTKYSQQKEYECKNGFSAQIFPCLISYTSSDISVFILHFSPLF